MIHAQRFSQSAVNSLAKGLLAASVTATLYLVVVILTTPNLPPAFAVNAAVMTNGPVISGTAAAIGAQTFFSSHGKQLGCALQKKRTGAGSTGAAFGSFLSFFSLVPLGCCGTWLVVLSFLPSILGGAISIFLIEYAAPLSHAATGIVLAFAALSGVTLRKRMKENGLL